MIKTVEAEDYHIIKHYLDMNQINESNLNLVNMYIWERLYNLSYEIYENNLILYCRFLEDGYAYTPLMRTKDYQSTFEYITNSGINVKYVPESYLNYLNHDMFQVKELEDNFDYIYDFEKLKTLAGKKYQKKRNHFNQFMRLYGDVYQFRCYDKSMKNEVIHFLYHWIDEVDEDYFLANELQGIERLLNNDLFEYEAGCLYIHNELVGFTIGSLVNDETIQINVEKANRAYEGIYIVLQRLFLEYTSYQVKYVNREDDMGHLNLRKAKESLHPLKLIKKYEVMKR